MLRLFVALTPPPIVRAELAALARPLAGVRWTPQENLHLTLRFIGATPPEIAERYRTVLERVQVEPFILPVGNVGVFPTRGSAKVLWAGVGQGHTRLYQLRKQVDEALLAVEPGLDVGHFHPHFTLGRLAESTEAKSLAQFVAQHAEFEAPPFRVSELHLLESEPTTGRAPAYRVIQTFALAR